MTVLDWLASKFKSWRHDSAASDDRYRFARGVGRRQVDLGRLTTDTDSPAVWDDDRSIWED